MSISSRDRLSLRREIAASGEVGASKPLRSKHIATLEVLQKESDDKHSLLAENEALRAQLDHMKTTDWNLRISNLQAEINNNTHITLQLQKDKTLLQQELNNMAQKLQTYDTKLTETNKQSEHYHSLLLAARDEIKNKENTWQTERTQLRNQLTELESNIASAKLLNAKLPAKVYDNKSVQTDPPPQDSKEQMKRMRDLQSQVAKLTAKVQELESNLQNMETLAAAETDKRKEVEVQLERLSRAQTPSSPHKRLAKQSSSGSLNNATSPKPPISEVDRRRRAQQEAELEKLRQLNDSQSLENQEMKGQMEKMNQQIQTMSAQLAECRAKHSNHNQQQNPATIFQFQEWVELKRDHAALQTRVRELELQLKYATRDIKATYGKNTKVGPFIGDKRHGKI